jgi:hypothetical protein
MGLRWRGRTAPAARANNAALLDPADELLCPHLCCSEQLCAQHALHRRGLAVSRRRLRLDERRRIDAVARLALRLRMPVSTAAENRRSALNVVAAEAPRIHRQATPAATYRMGRRSYSQSGIHMKAPTFARCTRARHSSRARRSAASSPPIPGLKLRRWGGGTKPRERGLAARAHAIGGRAGPHGWQAFSRNSLT